MRILFRLGRGSSCRPAWLHGRLGSASFLSSGTDPARARYERLEQIARRDAAKYRELSSILATGDQSHAAKLGSQATALQPVAKLVDDLDNARRQRADLLEMLTTSADPEWAKMVKEEVEEWQQKQEELEEELHEKVASDLIPEDGTETSGSAILEVRAGAGGSEAALFCQEIFEMYQNWSARNDAEFKVLEESPGPSGLGFREVSAEIRAEGIFAQLQHEAGVHRVQRVPQTDTSGRIHTSTVSVAVLPGDIRNLEVPPVREADCEIKTCRASGPGGQHVNTTDTAVRVKHLPTGLVVQNQDERSQLKNRQNALRELEVRIRAKAAADLFEKITADRRAQLGISTGERSDKIRTYNFSQDRVTDHRIPGFGLAGKLDDFLSGEQIVDDTFAALQDHFRELALDHALTRIEEGRARA